MRPRKTDGTAKTELLRIRLTPWQRREAAFFAQYYGISLNKLAQWSISATCGNLYSDFFGIETHGKICAADAIARLSKEKTRD